MGIPTKAKATRLSAALAIALTIMTMMAATLFVAGKAEAATASIAWDAPTSSTAIAGYKVHIGSTSGNYQQHIDVGNTTSYSTSTLSDGATYYFAVTAYNGSKVESPYSNEITRTIAAAPTTHTITANAGAGGTVTALNNTKVSSAISGSTTITSVTVTDGASQSFSIAPATGYRIADVTVNGASVGAVSSYTFAAVKSAQTISATFAAATVNYTITATAGTGGTIAPAGASTVASGGSKTYTIAPATGYRISAVTVNGTSVGAVTSYTFTNVTRNQTISATFAAATTSYTITATAGAGGTISPAGSVSVSRGTSRTFTITPNSGYKIKSLQVDGQWITAASSYTFTNVTANHSILAAFTATTTTTATSTSTAGRVVFATNSGGPYYKDAAGIAYGADSRFSGGSTKVAAISVANTTDDVLYHSYRYGNTFGYNIPVASGPYSVVLKFADNSGTGNRVFDVKAEGLTVLSSFDIYARAGNNTAYEVTVPVNVTDGTLNLGFVSRIGNAKVNAIVVKTR